MPKSVLIIEDENSIREALIELFDATDTAVRSAASLPDALHLLSRQAFHLIVTDIRLGAQADGGLQVMGAAGLLSPEAVVIALTAYPDADNRFASQRLGATYFLEKPADLLRIASLASRHGVSTALMPGVRDAE
ncbi:MAG: response regulator [Gemmatimonadaceae bacterium]